MIQCRALATLARLVPLLAIIACQGAGASPQPAAQGAAPSGSPAAQSPPSGGAPAAEAPAPAPAPPAPTRIRVIYTAVSGSILPLWIAKDAGFFAKHGIDAELEYIASSTTGMQAMLAGDVAFIPSLSAPTVVQAVLAGGDAVLIGATSNTVVFFLLTTPDVREYGDLRGKRLGITRLGSSTDAAARFALTKWGLRPDDDVAIVQMNGTPEILAGMQAGAVHAGVLSSPTDLHARQAGFRELADLGTIGLDYPQTTIGTTRTFLRTHEAVARAFLRATVEAVHLLKTDPERARAIFGKWTDNADPAILEATYRAYVDKTESVPYVKPAAMQMAIAEVAQTDPRANGARFEDFVDNRYVEELETSGFIRQLYGQ